MSSWAVSSGCHWTAGEPALGAGEFEAFHGAVGGACGDRRSRAETVDALVVVAGRLHLLRPRGPFQQGATLEGHRVRDVPVFTVGAAHVLLQGAAEATFEVEGVLRPVHVVETAGRGHPGLTCPAGTVPAVRKNVTA